MGIIQGVRGFSTFDSFVGKEFNLALFIDGLDEFDGKHENILDFVNLFHCKPGRRICVSSRPWNIFQDAFTANPSLKLENITEEDIRLYVQGKLESCAGFLEYKTAMSQQADSLVQAIITKAQGVFLWVSVVVLVIIEGLSEGDQWDEIHDMVNLLPEGLSQLYQRIWATIKPKYISESSHLFQIHRAYTGQLNAITMWLADHPDPLQIDIKTIDDQKMTLITHTMRRRLNSRTRGLLEISPARQVEFLHRSVRDWIEPIWSDIIAESKPAFDPNLCILKAETVKLSQIGYNNSLPLTATTFPRQFWQDIQDCLRYAVKVQDISSNTAILVATLDRLDTTLNTASMIREFPTDSMPIIYEAMSRQNSDKRELLPHWSATEGWDLHDNSFIGLAAQFAIFGYVRDKVIASPQLLRHRPNEVSILANAVLGPEYFLHQRFRHREGFLKHGSYARFLLVKFLLDSGAAKSSAYVPGSPHRTLYDEAISRPFYMPRIIMPGGANLDYWETIAKLLDEHGLSKLPKAGFLSRRLRHAFQSYSAS
ncbi:hypothetical protein CIB48_g2592 [Xylaria polymorpha]|nr:hypothetical protein CIB48_g2592 [Xylaria polymorpha]